MGRQEACTEKGNCITAAQATASCKAMVGCTAGLIQHNQCTAASSQITANVHMRQQPQKQSCGAHPCLPHGQLSRTPTIQHVERSEASPSLLCIAAVTQPCATHVLTQQQHAPRARAKAGTCASWLYKRKCPQTAFLPPIHGPTPVPGPGPNTAFERCAAVHALMEPAAACS